MSVRVVKMCDMPGIIAAKVFQMLNISHVKFTMKEKSLCGRVIITGIISGGTILPAKPFKNSSIPEALNIETATIIATR